MKDFIRDSIESPGLLSDNSPGGILREGAQKLVKLAVLSEFEEYISPSPHLKEADGKQSVVRNGYLPERTVMTAVGNIQVKVPRVNDRREGKTPEERLRFHSQILPPYLRRSSIGAFSEVLSQLLGEEVSPSAQTISRLNKKWKRIHGYKLLPVALKGDSFIDGLPQAA